MTSPLAQQHAGALYGLQHATVAWVRAFDEAAAAGKALQEAGAQIDGAIQHQVVGRIIAELHLLVIRCPGAREAMQVALREEI